MSYITPYIRRYGGLFLVAVLFLSGEALCDLLQPTIMSKVVDVGVANRDLAYIFRYGGIMLLVAGLGAIAAVGRNFVASTVSQAFGADLRHDLYARTVTLPFASLDRFEIATLVTRITNDVNQIQGFANGLMRIFVKAPLLCIGSIVMAILLDARLARVLEISLPIVALLVFASLRIGFPRYRVVQKKLDGVNGAFREYLAGVRVVKAFNRFDHERERFSTANTDLAEASMRAMRVMAIFTPGISFAVNVGIIAVLWFGGYRVDAGEIGAGRVIAFVNYMTQILFSLMIVAMVFNTFVRARASSERISEVLHAGDGSPLGAVPGDRSKNDSEGDGDGERSVARTDRASESECIRFDRVTFTYASRAGLPALNDVSFACRRGEMVGIIGSTGSGKSTLINLVPRFREVTSGAIFVDGVDVREHDPKELRSRIAVVPQRNILFSGTIEENIRWGRDGATQEEIEEAARIAQATEFIDAIPERWAARIGRGGLNLSGGQRQRMAIARAIIRKPEILILDDSSSALDSVTDAKVRGAIRRELAGTTLVVVAQRLTAVMEADRIIVLDDGKVSGVGTHDELIAGCEVYRDIYRSQIGAVEAPDV